MADSMAPTSFPDALQTATGRGVRVAIIDSGVNPAHPHVGSVAGGRRIGVSAEADSTDYLDYIGHGTAVAGAIREKAIDADLYSVKVFDRALTTNIDTIIRAIEWCVANAIDVVNLSLGTSNSQHRERIEATVAGATARNTIIVAAYEMSGKPSFPGCLAGVIGVTADFECPRESYRPHEVQHDILFAASAFPREIPGVPREQNYQGISFAVANMTGFVALARQMNPTASVTELKQWLADASTQ